MRASPRATRPQPCTPALPQPPSCLSRRSASADIRSHSVPLVFCLKWFGGHASCGTPACGPRNSQGDRGEVIMANLRIWTSVGLIALILIVATPPICVAQAADPPAAGGAPEPMSVGANTALAGPWEFTFDGRVGAPTG